MNLLQTIRTIEAVAAQQPSVASIVRNDVFRLNALPGVQYGVFAWLQGEHRTDAQGDLLTFNFTLFHVDRLTFDKGNEIEVQSTAIETLENILRGIAAYGIMAGEYTFRTFNQRFSDDCAGAFCVVSLEVPKDGVCPFDFPESETINIY